MKIKRFIWIAWLCLLLLASGEAAVLAPDLRCVAVNSNGQISISWIAPTDPLNEFVEYRILSSTDGSNFTQITTITNYATTNYTDPAANGNVGAVYYYLVTAWDDGTGVQVSSASPTLASLFIPASVPVSGSLPIAWSSMASPKPTTHSGHYKLFHHKSGTPWQLIDSIPYGTNIYSYPIAVCTDSLYFKLQVTDASGCVSVSNIFSLFVQDATPPDIPQIDSISVDTVNGGVMIGWKPSSAGDVEGYVVAYMVSSNTFLDTVYGAGTTFYSDPSSSPSAQPERYGVFAFDSCLIASTTGVIHRTIHLTKDMQPCNVVVNLSWSQYQGWSAGVESYLVFVSQDNGPWQLLHTAGGTETTFAHTGTNPGSNYTYCIRAARSGGGATSTSNSVTTSISSITYPAHFYLSSVSVTAPGNIQVKGIIDPATTAKYLRLKRSSGGIGNYETISQIPVPGTGAFTFSDGDVADTSTIYYYKVALIDDCNKEVGYSNASRNILLSAQPDNTKFINTISWTPYSDWTSAGNGVEEHVIYFSQERSSGYTQLGSASGTSLGYTHDLPQGLNERGLYCYYLEATEADGNLHGLKEMSRSNIACVTQRPVVFVPSAFSPNGNNMNETFRAEVSHIETGSYHMTVYDRWGRKVFETKDPDGEWNGGTEPYGLYVYVVGYKSTQGHDYTQRGEVVMFR